MTCIIGMVSKGKVHMGADSLASNNFTKTVMKESKVFENGEFLIGCCGSIRMMNLMKWKFSPPTVKDGDDLHKFMCTEFVSKLRECLKENGFGITTNDWKGGYFLVGIKGRLFQVQSDFLVIESDCIAIGSGEYHALGCLYGLAGTDLSPKKSILKALEAAEAFVTSVQRPFIVMKK